MGEILLIVSLGYLYLRAVTTNGGAQKLPCNNNKQQLLNPYYVLSIWLRIFHAFFQSIQSSAHLTQEVQRSQVVGQKSHRHSKVLGLELESRLTTLPKNTKLDRNNNSYYFGVSTMCRHCARCFAYIEQMLGFIRESYVTQMPTTLGRAFFVFYDTPSLALAYVSNKTTSSTKVLLASLHSCRINY